MYVCMYVCMYDSRINLNALLRIFIEGTSDVYKLLVPTGPDCTFRASQNSIV